MMSNNISLFRKGMHLHFGQLIPGKGTSKVKLALLYVVLLISTMETSCSTTSFGEKADSLFLITDDVTYYYELKQPEKKYFLPYVLAEISGLSCLDQSRLMCIEDEGGRAYEYDLQQEKVTNAITFAQPGDYEGVEVVDDQVFVLRSDGDIFQFTYTDEDIASAEKYETELSSSNDAEGLGYNPRSKRLLIACKEDGDSEDVDAKGRAVYEYDPEDHELEEELFFDITSDDLDDFFEAHRDFDYDKDRIKFEPSAIAYNPKDGYYYIIAATGKLMVVLNKKGEIKATYPIAPRILSQPEGICFDKEGTLYISSEGEGDKGYILKFTVKKK